jgi:hypothetical protein
MMKKTSERTPESGQIVWRWKTPAGLAAFLVGDKFPGLFRTIE